MLVFAVSFGGLFTECLSIHPTCQFSYVFTQFVLHHKISLNILDYSPAWKLKFCMKKKKNRSRAINWNINASFISNTYIYISFLGEQLLLYLIWSNNQNFNEINKIKLHYTWSLRQLWRDCVFIEQTIKGSKNCLESQNRPQNFQS